jgi:hypothetical protein
MADPCPDCGKDRVLVGYRHLCVPVSANANVEQASRRSSLWALERHHASRVTPATQLNQALTRVAELEEEVGQLKRQLARRVDTTTVASTECSTCKARRDVKARAQKRWRRKAEKRK